MQNSSMHIYSARTLCVTRMISSCHQSMQKIGQVIAKDYHNLILYNLLTIEYITGCI